ncbi:MAG TPA: ATP-binding cassette domain-containing protein [Nocardioidaceae bacterium]|nr:ATP-binding cassette domain-containing protein [Nocardioidaceae bacterium]
MTLDAHVVVRHPALNVDVALDCAAGEVLGLLGPNGAGKTTCLRALAGLRPLDAGSVRIGDVTVEDPAADVRLPAADRRVGVVFADPLLFPHLSARDNVAFGLAARGATPRVARETATHWLERLGIAGLATRRPAALSSGQAQRVALARALAGQPEVLLLDEPFSALDAESRSSLRALLGRHLRTFAGATVLVSHDALDAKMLADRLVVLEQGRVVQAGETAQVAATPRTPYVARFAGLNLVRGMADNGVVDIAPAVSVVSASDAAGAAFACFSPTAVALHRERPSGSPRNVWPVVVKAVVPYGASFRVQLDAGFPLLADITSAALTGLDLVVDEHLWASVKATEVSVYPA